MIRHNSWLCRHFLSAGVFTRRISFFICKEIKNLSSSRSSDCSDFLRSASTRLGPGLQRLPRQLNSAGFGCNPSIVWRSSPAPRVGDDFPKHDVSLKVFAVSVRCMSKLAQDLPFTENTQSLWFLQHCCLCVCPPCCPWNAQHFTPGPRFEGISPSFAFLFDRLCRCSIQKHRKEKRFHEFYA